MTAATRKIEIDEATAAALEARAADEGVSISELVAQLIVPEPLSLPTDQVAELDRRWAAVEAGEPTVPHEEVVRWLRTWGTPAFRPWRV
jgi:predicted transcriptional regulator